MRIRFIAAVAVLTLIACVRVASTHRVFSQTLDEPAHLAAGFQWFDGEYTIDTSHPPLARILGALPLRFGDFPRVYGKDIVARGTDLLYHGNRYEKTLARVRIGNLLLLAIACAATAAWGLRLASPGVAILAVAMLTTLPAILGHAGVLTTDLAAVAAIALALLALDRFIERPTIRRGAFLGLAIAIGLLAKFSFLVFFPVCALCALVGLPQRQPGQRRRAAVVAIVVALLVTWAGYRFDFRTAQAFAGNDGIYPIEQSAPKALRSLARSIALHVPLPAPAFFVGLGWLKIHDAEGHDAFLLGRTSRKGWWYYFPVLFFYKTPIPFMLLATWGAIAAVRARNRRMLSALLIAIGMLGVAMTSSINIGLRHVLPLYVPLSIVAAYGVADIWRRSTDAFGRVTLAALLLWLFAGVAAAHPDYLAWFNELAQPNPASIAVDSNLDWGQDTLRLVRTLREMQIESPHIDILSNVRVANHGIEPVPFDPNQKVTGWLAVSETQLVVKGYEWLKTYRPVTRIGQSIRLYHIPAARPPALVAPPCGTCAVVP
jgi:hypothetical protein